MLKELADNILVGKEGPFEIDQDTLVIGHIGIGYAMKLVLMDEDEMTFSDTKDLFLNKEKALTGHQIVDLILIMKMPYGHSVKPCYGAGG